MLAEVRAGKLGVEQAVARLKHLPFEDLGFAKIDHHRTLRQGFAEVVFASGKTPQQVAAIVRALLRPSKAKQSVSGDACESRSLRCGETNCARREILAAFGRNHN